MTEPMFPPPAPTPAGQYPSAPPVYPPAVPAQYPPPYLPAPPAFGMPGQRLCPGCRNTLVVTAVVCPACGTALGTPKDKTIAVLLAVFLGFWTWLYTYPRDSSKFWIGLVLNLVSVPLWFAFGFGLLVEIGVWIWAIVDVAAKSQHYYAQFPNAV